MKRSVFGVIVAFAAVLGVMLAIAVPAGARSAVRGRPGESIQVAVDAAPPGATIYVRRGTYAENVAITTDGITLRSDGAKIVPPATPARKRLLVGGEDARRRTASARSETSPSPDPEGGPAVVNTPVRNVTISGFNVAGFPGSGIFSSGPTTPSPRGTSRPTTASTGSSGSPRAAARSSATGRAPPPRRGSTWATLRTPTCSSPGTSLRQRQFGLFFRDAAHG